MSTATRASRRKRQGLEEAERIGTLRTACRYGGGERRTCRLTAVHNQERPQKPLGLTPAQYAKRLMEKRSPVTAELYTDTLLKSEGRHTDTRSPRD